MSAHTIRNMTFLLKKDSKTAHAIIQLAGEEEWELEDFANYRDSDLKDPLKGDITTVSAFVQRIGPFPMNIVCIDKEPCLKMKSILSKFPGKTCVDTTKVLCNLYDEGLLEDIIFYMGPPRPIVNGKNEKNKVCV